MRILFLDFDGVLHSCGGAPGMTLPFEWLDILERLLAPHPDVGLVVHSSWRYEHSPADLAGFLGSLEDRFLSAAPEGSREAAVLAALDVIGPAITDFRILDDAPDEFDELTPRLIACESLTGLSNLRVQAQLGAWLKDGSK